MESSATNELVEKTEISNSTSNQPIKPDNHGSSSSFKRTYCRFFNTYGHCKFGRNCHFYHSRPRFYQNYENRNLPIRKTTIYRNSQYKNPTQSLDNSQEKVTCRFFQGNKEVKSEDFSSETTSSNDLPQNSLAVNHELDLQSQSTSVDNVSLNDVKKPILSNVSNIRKLEIQLLNKRYPQCKHREENECDIFEVTFSSSDPDWVFMVKFIQLEINLGKLYPEEVCVIMVLDEKNELPPLLLKHLNKAIKGWLEEKHKSNVKTGNYELFLRPFFKWLDRNLENIFVEGLRKVKQDIEAQRAGIEFVPYESLPGASKNNDQTVKSSDEDSIEHSKSDNCTNNDKSPEMSDKENINGPVSEYTSKTTSCLVETNSSGNDSRTNSYNVPKRGTEVKLIGIELSEGTASLECKKISLILNCSRCKTSKEVTASPKQSFSYSCTKCHKILQLTFQPSLIHQHSNVLGYLHLFECQALDLILPQCAFHITCLNCNKQNSVDGIHYGQASSTWCLFCNQKLSLIVQTRKFHQLQPAMRIGKTPSSPSEKKQVKVKDIALEHGKPLPKEGTCVHYKKSHRWLRFPCCGKLYPCDVCHTEAETDHEMKFATRMVCGFCSKEQPYNTDKPCISCASFVTKKSGKHWEGGKGCRDKLKMSRDDKHKYAGTNKTISRKVVLQKMPKKKS